MDINQVQYFSYYFEEKYYQFHDFLFQEKDKVEEIFLIFEGGVKLSKFFSIKEDNHGSPKNKMFNFQNNKHESKKRKDIYNCGKEDFVGIYDVLVGNQTRNFDCQISSLDGSKVNNKIEKNNIKRL